MKDDLISLSDEAYYHGSAVILGESSYVKVIVENSYDVPFWQDFLEGVAEKMTFDITPFDHINHDLSMGKAHIYRLSEEGKLGPHYIGCVDADYDYLLGSHTKEGEILKKSKYLVHTFAYSIENLLCCHHGFSKICAKACKCQVNYPFGQWMDELAMTVHPLLLWALYLDSRDDAHEVFSASDWRKVFPRGKTYSDGDSAPQEIIDEIKRIVKTLISDIEDRVTRADIEAKDKFAQDMAERLDPRDSLFYVRGHDLFSFVLDIMLEPICRKEKNKRLAVIDAKSKSKTVRDNIRNQFLKQIVDPRYYLDVNYIYKKKCPSIIAGMEALFKSSRS